MPLYRINLAQARKLAELEAYGSEGVSQKVVGGRSVLNTLLAKGYADRSWSADGTATWFITPTGRAALESRSPTRLAIAEDALVKAIGKP